MRRQCRRPDLEDAGIATTSAALVMAVAVFVIAGTVQAALYYHGVQRAEAPPTGP